MPRLKGVPSRARLRTWTDGVRELARCSTIMQARSQRPHALPPRGGVVWAIQQLARALDCEARRDPCADANPGPDRDASLPLPRTIGELADAVASDRAFLATASTDARHGAGRLVDLELAGEITVRLGCVLRLLDRMPCDARLDAMTVSLTEREGAA